MMEGRRQSIKFQQLYSLIQRMIPSITQTKINEVQMKYYEYKHEQAFSSLEKLKPTQTVLLIINAYVYVDDKYNFPMVVINQNPFYLAATGGIILAIATSLNYALRGRVTGMSGIIYGILTLHKEDLHEKLSIIGGMLLASGIFFDIFGYGSSNFFTPFGAAESIASQTSYVGYALAGVLVGFGTKLSNGCTSGHGLCGLPRLSIRSLVAVCVFLFSAIAISTLRYHVTLGPFSQGMNPTIEYNHTVSANLCVAVGVILPIIGAWVKREVDDKMSNRELMVEQLITFVVGLVFGTGLLVAGMVRRINILGFLGLGSDWNPSLLFVLGCGVLVNLITFNYMLQVKTKSLLGRHLFNPDNKTIDWKLILGATCFGLGWGIGGLCPGPALMQLSVFTLPVHVIWFGCLLAGMTISRKLEHYLHQQEEKAKEQIKAREEEERKEHHQHHHRNSHHENNAEPQLSDIIIMPHLHPLPPLKVQPKQEAPELDPIANLFKQQSGDSLRITAPQTIHQESTFTLGQQATTIPSKNQ